ncbi:hypothetical protein HQ560_18970 [bacterium]|nr:hypothetical protein [bacterium]
MADSSLRGMDVRVEPWHDLVYHVLAHLQIHEDDASSLYDDWYVAWAAERFPIHTAPQGLSRTLPRDAGLMARLYDAAPAGYRLHAWPSLWDDVDAFLRDMPTGFHEIEWPNPLRGRLAGGIILNTGAVLPELFRTALWSEWQCGYESVWQSEVRPHSEAYRPVFAAHLAEAADRVPGLRERTWVLCHPLRIHGRVLPNGLILVGVADEELGVGELGPVLQACHEHLVSVFQERLPGEGDWATAPGRDGYDAFMEVEGAALTVGMRVFAGSRWEVAYRVWLGRVFRGDGNDAVKRLADGEFLTPRSHPVVDALTS